MTMLRNIRTYTEFLEKQNKERENFLNVVSTKIVDGLTDYLKGWGWERKGKSGGLTGDKIKGVKYTKKFNGKDVTIEYRNNLRHDTTWGGLYYSTGYNEFIHDKSLGQSVEIIRMTSFHWNDEDTSGWSLDEVLRRMDEYYSK